MSTLGKVLTIGEVAKLAGWSRLRMWRHLMRLNTELGGMLLTNVGRGSTPRWTVTLAALQGVAPNWFQDTSGLEARLVAVEERLEALVRIQNIHTTALARSA